MNQLEYLSKVLDMTYAAMIRPPRVRISTEEQRAALGLPPPAEVTRAVDAMLGGKPNGFAVHDQEDQHEQDEQHNTCGD
jgi:hypothetical protein